MSLSDRIAAAAKAGKRVRLSVEETRQVDEAFAQLADWATRVFNDTPTHESAVPESGDVPLGTVQGQSVRVKSGWEDVGNLTARVKANIVYGGRYDDPDAVDVLTGLTARRLLEIAGVNG